MDLHPSFRYDSPEFADLSDFASLLAANLEETGWQTLQDAVIRRDGTTQDYVVTYQGPRLDLAFGNGVIRVSTDPPVAIRYEGIRGGYLPPGAEAGILLCPRCGGSCIHQGEVTVVNRTGEDGPGVAITVKGQGGKGKRLTKEEIPYRRNHLTIKFHCEYCERNTQGKGPLWATLEITQHKGRTYIRWIMEENPTVGSNIYTGKTPT